MKIRRLFKPLCVLCAAMSSAIGVARGAGDDEYRFDHGPYLQGLTETGVHVYFTTSAKGFSWVELRRAGTDSARRVVTVDNGLIEANNTRNKIELGGLEADTGYEYRLVSVPILRFRLSRNIYGDTISTPWYGFRTPDPHAESCAFIVTSDIHDDAAKYDRLLSALPTDSVDMVFLLGDILSHFSREGQPYSSFIDVSVERFARERPFVLVRGNHDTRGSMSRTYPDYIHRPHGRFYGSYVIGDTYIIMLDTGEDKPDSHHDYSGLTAFEDYRREQAEWLERVMKTKAFRKAGRRIVLAHIPPLPRGESTRASVHTSDVLYRTYLPILNRGKIDLMISGHTHEFMLLEPGGDTAHNFPILVNDNNSASFVRSTPDGISVRTVNDKGVVTFEKRFGR